MTKGVKSRIYLIGFMGVGKSTVGKHLAAALNYRFVDTDKLFERKYKTNIDLFFKKYGEEIFRKLEREVLEETFSMENTVVSTGGGSVINGGIDAINRYGLSIYLKMDENAIASRLAVAKRQRPLIKGMRGEELSMFIKNKLEEREPLYVRAHIVFDSFNPDIKRLVEIIGSYQ